MLAVSHREQGRLQELSDGQDHINDENNRMARFSPTQAQAFMHCPSCYRSLVAPTISGKSTLNSSKSQWPGQIVISAMSSGAFFFRPSKCVEILL
jgi:hypothetical protein